MISKELLSEVLEEEVLEIYGFTNSKTRLEYKLLSRVDGESINIHELAHKCKEYLLDKGYCIIIHAFKVELFEKDSALKEKRDRWHEDLQKDIYVEETLNVISEMKPISNLKNMPKKFSLN